MRITKIALIVPLLLLAFIKPVFAMSTPDFPSCLNPQGQQIANYPTGTHGIVGSSATYTGADSVYSLNTNQAMQCFCSDTGNGIQTNWQKVTNYSADDLAILEKEGWTYIPDGSAWGLSAEPYLTQNTDFACLAGTGGTNSSTNNGGSQSNNSASPAGSVLTAATNTITTLANTGNVIYIYAAFLLSILSFSGYIVVSRRTSK